MNTEGTPASLTVLLFGPMQVRVQGRPLPRLRSRKALWLLALLVMRGGRAVEREWLAETLWPDADPGRGAANLRAVLSELRQALGGEGGRLQSPGRHTLSFDLAGASVDVQTFDAAALGREPSSLRQAVALYRGPLLEGCAEEWVPQERAVREQACLHALEVLAEAALAAGACETAADDYRRVIFLDPWREASQRGLMRALALGGDVNAALSVYQALIRLLRKDDPRAMPDEITTALYARLRAEARQRASAPDVIAAADTVVPTVTGYLPHPLTDLVGREDEREEVAARLRRSRLVTLTGPGGIGKTRLALAVAAEAAPEFADGAWLVALDALTDGEQIAPQIAGVLGLREDAGRTPRESLTDHLHARRLLLVLDNCEHLRDAAAEVTAHLLRACAGLHILTTSREALGLTGEAAWSVPALSVPDPAHLPAGRASRVRVLAGYEGIQLFVERAQAVQKTFALSRDNAPAVAQICARLGGLPLAIELAAARTRVLTVEQIASRLDDHLALLTGGSRVSPGRHQTLRATLDWSYSLLGTAEQALLARLSVFAGGWTLEAAEAVCSGDGIGQAQVLDLLASLADKSLVIFEVREDAGRYRFLETLRQYAAERLGAGGAGVSRAKHRGFFLALAEEARPRLTGPDQVVWLRRLAAESNNLRSALDWAVEGDEDGGPGLRLAYALYRFWRSRGDYAEGRSASRRALAHAGPQADPALRTKVLSGLAGMAFYQRDFGEAKAVYQECLENCRASGDRNGAAGTLGNLGVLALNLGDFAEARPLLEDSLSIHQAHDDRHNIARRLCHLGSLARHQNEMVRARAMFERSLGLYRELGDQSGIGTVLTDLSNTVQALGDHATARTLAEESLALAREAESTPSTVQALITLGGLARFQHDLSSAQAFYEESLSLARRLSDHRFIAYSLLGLGETAFSCRDLSSARSFFGESLEHFQGIGEGRGEGAALRGLGDIAQDQQDAVSAQALYRDSLRMMLADDDKIGQLELLSVLAASLLSQKRSRKTVRLSGAVSALRQEICTPLPPSEQEKQGRQMEQGSCRPGRGRLRGRVGRRPRPVLEAGRGICAGRGKRDTSRYAPVPLTPS